MARKIIDFLPQFKAPDSDYPYGQIKDDTGAGDGTDINVRTFGDIFQFFAKLMDVAGVVYNSVPDNAYTGFQLFQALQTYILYLINSVVKVNAWTALSLASGWSNDGGGYAPAGYTVDNLGRVTLRGRVSYTSGSSGTYIALFTAALPVGCRPAYLQNFPCSFGKSGGNVSTQNANEYSVQIDSTGQVKLMNYNNVTGITGINLDGISFYNF